MSKANTNLPSPNVCAFFILVLFRTLIGKIFPKQSDEYQICVVCSARNFMYNGRGGGVCNGFFAPHPYRDTEIGNPTSCLPGAGTNYGSLRHIFYGNIFPCVTVPANRPSTAFNLQSILGKQSSSITISMAVKEAACLVARFLESHGYGEVCPHVSSSHRWQPPLPSGLRPL